MNTKDTCLLTEVLIQPNKEDLALLFEKEDLDKPDVLGKVMTPNGVMITVISHVAPVRELRYRVYCYKCKIDHVERKLGVLSLILTESNKTQKITSWTHEVLT